MANENQTAPKPAVKVSLPKQQPVGANAVRTEDTSVLKRNPFITCIALGQGGYTALTAMLEKPFVKAENCFYINYQSDLMSAELIDPNNRINITTDETKFGAGHERSEAKKDATDNMAFIVSQLKEKISPKTEKIYVLMSSGGGTGSGAGPLISALVSQSNFLEGKRVSVEVILFKPALGSNSKEWYNYNECLKEMTALVNAKTVSLFVADLSSSDNPNPNERNLEVDRKVADLLYRFDCYNYLSKISNLDFADRDVLTAIPQMRSLLEYNPADGTWSSPFVQPKGNRVARLGYEVPEGDEERVNTFSKSFGVTVLDGSFKGLYPASAVSKGARPIVGFFGFSVPVSTLKEASDTVAELIKREEQSNKNDSIKSQGAFDMLAVHKKAIEESTQRVDQSLDSIMNMIQ